MVQPLSSNQPQKLSTSVFGPNSKDNQMSLKHEQLQSVAASAPEPIGTVVGKLGIVWAGLFAGMTLGEWVLLTTLVYTLLQISLLVVERIIKPLWALRAEHIAAEAQARMNSYFLRWQDSESSELADMSGNWTHQD